MPPLLTGTSRRGPRALKRMALAVAVRNIASITDLGDMSFADARPLLLHIENPHQLHALATQCPQLAAEPGQMADVWKRLLAKKVPDWGTRDYLREMGYDEEEDEEEDEDEDEDDVFDEGDDEDDAEDDRAARKRRRREIPWYEIYCRLKDAQDQKEAAATARLQQALGGFNRDKASRSTELVTGWQASRALNRKMPGVGVVRHRRGGAGAGGGPAPSAALSFGGGSRTKMTNGQSVLRRARREAREISKAAQLSTPTGRLAVDRSQIRAPPPAMLHDHRVAQQPEIVTGDVVIRAPGRRRLSATGTGGGGNGSGSAPARSSMAGLGLGVGNPVREARLLALKRGGTAASPTGAAAAAAAAGAPTPPRKEKPAPEKEKRSRVERELAERKASSRNPKPGRRVADDDAGAVGGGDDDLFGEADDELFGETPVKRRRLYVDDLERTASGSSSRVSKPVSALPKRSSLAVPRPTIAKPMVTTKPVLPPALPSRPAPALGPPRKKPVDIFMKKKKR